MAVLTAPDRIRNPTTTTKRAEDQAQHLRADHVHGEAGDQIVFVHRDADRVRNEHHGQQRRRGR